MLRSVGVLLALVLGFVGYQTLLGDDPDPVPVIDYTVVAEAARSSAPFEVLAPEHLPTGWRATSARYTPGPPANWHLGLLTTDDKYVGLEQIANDTDDAVAAFSPDTVAVGSSTINGERWQLRLEPSGDETTLVRSAGTLSTIVTGTATQDALVGFVESLQP